jgi:ppGpp synthetase/RelA/SpoT-type nucleotidyltranferase
LSENDQPYSCDQPDVIAKVESGSSALIAHPSIVPDRDAVRRAGEVIGGDMIWLPETEQHIREAFAVANQWRDSHDYPMRSIHATLRSHIRLRGIDGFTAARLKRMNAIRGKLRRLSDRDRPLSLDRFQDLGGCRAIMATIDDVNALIAALKARCRHELWAEDDYIHKARKTGYRSHHLKYEFQGRGSKATYNGRRIEVQVRTTLQHAWATAVEAIGLYRGEELKSGKGSPEWLRLFALMSAEFAEFEGCDPAKGMPSRTARLRELKELDGQLGAAQALENMSTALSYVEDAVQSISKPDYFLIEYDNEARTVKVTPQFRSRFAFKNYETAENADNFSGQDTANIVLVEGVKMEHLTKAYPNYFGDTQLFKQHLGALVAGGAVRDYELTLQQRSVPRPRERPDPSWIGHRGMWTEPTPKSKKKKRKKR